MSPEFDRKYFQGQQNPSVPAWARILFWFLAVFIVFSMIKKFTDIGKEEISYSTFRRQLSDGNIKQVTVKGQKIMGTLRKPVSLTEKEKDEKNPTYDKFITYLPSFGDDRLFPLLEQKNVEVNTRPTEDYAWLGMVVAFLPFILLIVLGYSFLRRMQRQGQGLFSIGRSQARRYERRKESTTFADVAGSRGAKTELQEIIEYLKQPGRFQKIGGKIPKGVLLMGPPGTGKTLLARAVAGEAGVPFFSITGSAFMEMFVGVGASRVREMFREAKKDAPAIIFIDELDSIGRKSGADLENILNEAALLAAREGKEKIEQEDIEKAQDKVLIGLERENLGLSDRDRRMLAYHEGGHSVAASLLPNADPIHKATIVPRGRAMGVTQQLPEKEKYIYPREYLMDRLAVMLGGRAAEGLVLHTMTSGAENDLKQATILARKMILDWGMSEKLGNMAWSGPRQNVFLGEEIAQRREYSEATAREIDEEIKKIVTEAYEKALEVLKENREGLDRVADALIEKEEITGEEIHRLLNRKPRRFRFPLTLSSLPNAGRDENIRGWRNQRRRSRAKCKTGRVIEWIFSSGLQSQRNDCAFTPFFRSPERPRQSRPGRKNRLRHGRAARKMQGGRISR